MLETLDADTEEQAPRNETLKALEHQGSGADAAERMLALIGHSRFFSDFTRNDIEMLAREMLLYRAQPGQTMIREGDVDDFMLLVIEGRVDIMKRDRHGMRQPMTSVGPGATLGEMSMIDGEPRFATCIAAETTTFATLSRDAMVKIIVDEPSLGTKLLIKLVTLLSARLRLTSQNLVSQMVGP